MQSGHVCASQLLAAFLGNVKQKISQAITNNDFSGELAKHLPKQLSTSGTVGLEDAGAVKKDASDSDSGASTTGSPVFSEAKSGGSLHLQAKGLTSSSPTIKDIKSKANAEKSLFVSNPAIVQTVLANLHYPAQARDKCEALLSKQGRISIQDLNSILDTQPGAGSGAAAEVPAASVRAMVASLVKASGNAEGKTAGVAKSLKSSVAVKPDGSYTRGELRNLLDKVVQASQTTGQQTLLSARSSSTPAALETTTVEGLKTGQTEELASTVLPSFISDGRKDSAGRVLSGATVGKAPDSQNANGQAAVLRENMVKDYSMGSTSSGRAGAENPGSSPGDGETISTSMEAIMRGGESGPWKVSAAAAAPAQEEQTDATSDFGVATGLVDWINEGRFSEQSDSGASAAKTGGDSIKEVESSAELGGQDTPMLGKQIEKFAGGKDQPSENGVLQSAGASTDDNLINLKQMNHSGGEGSAFYDRNQQAESVQQARGAKTIEASTTSLSDDGIATILASYTSSDDETGSTAGIFSGSPDNQKSGGLGANTGTAPRSHRTDGVRGAGGCRWLQSGATSRPEAKICPPVLRACRLLRQIYRE